MGNGRRTHVSQRKKLPHASAKALHERCSKSVYMSACSDACSPGDWKVAQAWICMMVASSSMSICCDVRWPGDCQDGRGGARRQRLGFRV